MRNVIGSTLLGLSYVFCSWCFIKAFNCTFEQASALTALFILAQLRWHQNDKVWT